MRVVALVFTYLLQLAIFSVLLGLEQVGGAIILSAAFFLLSVSRRLNLIWFSIFSLSCSLVLSAVSLIPWWQSYFLLFVATVLFYGLRKLAFFSFKPNLLISIGFLVIGLLVLTKTKINWLLAIQAIVSLLLLFATFYTPFCSRLANKQWVVE